MILVIYNWSLPLFFPTLRGIVDAISFFHRKILFIYIGDTLFSFFPFKCAPKLFEINSLSPFKYLSKRILLLIDDIGDAVYSFSPFKRAEINSLSIDSIRIRRFSSIVKIKHLDR